jgi:hypothetical protein
VLWGLGGALQSGSLQSLVYDELARHGRADGYARVIGRSEAVSTAAMMAASALAAPLLEVGGYRALGVASVATTVFAAVAGWSFPSNGAPGAGERAKPGGSYLRVLRKAVAEVRGERGARRSLTLTALLAGLSSLEEYIPLLALATGVRPEVVPLLVLLVMAGMTAGGWLAGRGGRWVRPALATAALCLAAGAGSGSSVGFVAVAAAFGVFQWAGVAAEARLQDAISGEARATVTSLASLAAEAVAMLTFAAYALGSLWAGPRILFVVAGAVYLGVAALRWR